MFFNSAAFGFTGVSQGWEESEQHLSRPWRNFALHWQEFTDPPILFIFPGYHV